MATKSTITVQDSLALLNEARSLTPRMANSPVIDANNIRYIADLDGWTYNDFTGMVDKITRQYGYNTAFRDEDNPFYRYFRESLPVGHAIEEYYIPLITPTEFDPTGANVLAPIENNILKRVFSLNKPITFAATTSLWQGREAFLTIEGVNDLQNRIISNMWDSAAAHTYKNCANLLSNLPAEGCAVEKYGYDVDSQANIQKLLREVRTAVDNMTILQPGYNTAGIEQRVDRSDLIVVTTPEVYQHLTVDFLAGVFNITYANMDTRVILISDSAMHSNPYSANLLLEVIDPRNLVIFKGREYAGSIVNPKGAFENTFLSQDFCYNVTNWWNAVAFFSGEAPTYSMTANEVGGTGTVVFTPTSPQSANVAVNLKITPPSGKSVSALQMDGTTVKYDVTDGYNFIMPNHNVVFTITYA